MDINQLLERIATALEESNRITQHWTDLNAVWHDKAEALTEKRYQEKRESDERYVKLQQTWHDEAERLNELRYQEQKQRDEQSQKAQEAMLEEQIRRQDALAQSAHDAYLKYIKEQAKP